jgi:formate hydrogenlyase transcriptional activator
VGTNAILIANMSESEQTQSGVKNEQTSSQYRALLDISESIARHRDFASLMRELAMHLRTVVQFDGVAIVLHDSSSGNMRMLVLESNVEIRVPMPDEFPIEEAAGGWVWQTQQPVIVHNTAQETRFPVANRIMHENGLKSYCMLPLTSVGRRLGALGFGSLQQAAYLNADLGFMQKVANQVAVAVDNALNFESAQAAQQQLTRERDRLRLLLEVNNAVTAHLDLREVFTAISASLSRVMNLDAAGMTLYDQESGQLRAFALEPQLAAPAQLPIEEGNLFSMEGTPGALAIASRQTVLVTRADIENSSSPVVQRVAADGIKSGCVAPLISHGRVLGTVDVVSLREDAFTKQDAELLTQIAGQIAIAVENALNFEAARAAEIQMARDRDRLSLLLNITNTIVSRHDLRELIRIISSNVRDTLRHDLMGLSIYDPEINQLRTYMYDFVDNKPFIEEGYSIPLEGSFTGMTFSTGKPFFMNIDYEKFNTDFNKRFREAGFKSGGCVPLIAHGRKLGTLGVVSFREHTYSEDEADLLCLIANQVAIALENVLAYREIEALKNKLSEEKLYLEEEINTAYDFEQIIGSSPALRRILKQVETVAPTDSTVLIQGETGTGKELIARAIHSLSARRERTLVKLNCAAIPTGLLESELFGHEKGAFTGAIAQRIGRFELANKGTLFLDEVGEIPQELQPKLLRVLQEKEFERLGSTRTISVDIRLIAATNRNLDQMVAERQFRDDLYYRLNVFPITIPSLRERPEDIPLLVRFFASKFARRMKKRIETIPTEAVAALQRHHWHGNIRELENYIERAVILTQGTELQFESPELKLPARAAISIPSPSNTATTAGPVESNSLDAVEREHILRILNETDWIVGGPNGAAARLGLKRTTLQARMKKLNIARHRTAP